jgi:hypothetical protein
MKQLTASITSILIVLAAVSLLAAAQDGSGGPRLSSREELRAGFEAIPCKNKDRLAGVRALFEKLGAAPQDLNVQKIRSTENLVLRKASTGDSAQKIIVGAHFDKTANGCGAIDNWTGVVALAHLYRAFREVAVQKEIIFVAFGREEEGLLGANELANSIKKEERENVCVMINIDSLGMGIPQTLDNVSTPSMIDYTVSLANEKNIPFSHMGIVGAGADSSPFRDKKIPAVTIHGLTARWKEVLHTSGDQTVKVNFDYVFDGYRVAAALLERAAAVDCQLFRSLGEKKKGK